MQMLVVQHEGYLPLVKFFFKQVTVEQWHLIINGTADDASKIVFADLVVHTISSLAKTTQKAVGDTLMEVTAKQVLDSLGNLLPQSFAQALEVHEEVLCAREEKLTKLVSEEVASYVNFGLLDDADPEKEADMTKPERLNTMINQALTLVKKIASNFKCHTPGAYQRRRSLKADNFTPMASEKDDGQSSEDSYVAQRIVQQMLSDFTEPFLDNVLDTEYDLLVQSPQDIVTVAGSITQLVLQDVESPHKQRLSRAVCQKIKRIFGKCVSRAWVYRLVQLLRRKYEVFFHKPAPAKSTMLLGIQQLDVVINSVFPEDEEKPVNVGELSFLQRCELQEQAYQHLFSEIMMKPMRKTVQSSRSAVAVYRCVLYSDVQRSMWIFQVVMNWWVMTQAGKHAEWVLTQIEADDALQEIKDKLSAASRSGTQVDKLNLSLHVTSLISQIFNEAKVDYWLGEREGITTRLTEKIWSEVKDVHIERELTPKDFEKINKVVYKNLKKRHGNALTVVKSLLLMKQEDEQTIVSAFTAHMLQEKHPSAMLSFFRVLILCTFATESK